MILDLHVNYRENYFLNFSNTLVLNPELQSRHTDGSIASSEKKKINKEYLLREKNLLKFNSNSWTLKYILHENFFFFFFLLIKCPEKRSLHLCSNIYWFSFHFYLYSIRKKFSTTESHQKYILTQIWLLKYNTCHME